MSGNCCNLFSLSGACTSQCPGNSTINSEFQCTCDRGYTSNSNNTECVDVDECASAPCLNNGICQDGRGDFACLCHDGFSGETCETCNVPFCRTCMFNNTGNQTVCVECNGGYALEFNECRKLQCTVKYMPHDMLNNRWKSRISMPLQQWRSHNLLCFLFVQ